MPSRKRAARTKIRRASRAISKNLVVDYDGTITEADLLDAIAQRFGDPDVYREVDEALDGDRITLRECITREYEPVRAPLDEVVAWVLENARVRAGFVELVGAAEEAGWNFLVASSGFEELIRPVLEREGVDVQVVANRVEPRPDGWRVLWRDEAACPNCGQPCKRSSLPDGTIVYVGDGYSDRCAALAADRVFATSGLAAYLAERGVAFHRFDDFISVADAIADESVLG
jgi:2-hydroxy-3-keto-5-methylthiopentenyl-1-phosphate phosphatase